MTPIKRKLDEFIDSDEEEPSYGKQTLPVADLPYDFEGEPMDGMQYLFLVRRDARTLPHITRVDNPYETPTRYIPSPRETVVHPLVPSPEWRLLFGQRFRNFRQNLNQPTIHVHIPSNPSRRLIPEKAERDLWWKFLAGEPESVWNPLKLPKQKKKHKGMQGMRAWDDPDVDSSPHEVWHIDDEDGQVALKYSETSDGTNPTEADEGIVQIELTEGLKSELTPREPTMTLLKHIDHKMALHLLMYFAHWMNLHLQKPTPPTFRLKESHARWMFTLLSRVDDYLSADEMHLLRSLARACLSTLISTMKERSDQTESGHTEDRPGSFPISNRSCWMIISVISGIWAQHDLWMDAEDVISGALKSRP